MRSLGGHPDPQPVARPRGETLQGSSPRDAAELLGLSRRGSLSSSPQLQPDEVRAETNSTLHETIRKPK